MPARNSKYLLEVKKQQKVFFSKMLTYNFKIAKLVSQHFW